MDKQTLLIAYKKAVREKNATQAIDILKQLDHHLTKSEAAELMESASQMFHRKLQTLGGEFSLAVTKREWEEALKVGNEIIRDFPNSKMASEVRPKLPSLESMVNNKSFAKVAGKIPSDQKYKQSVSVKGQICQMCKKNTSHPTRVEEHIVCPQCAETLEEIDSIDSQIQGFKTGSQFAFGIMGGIGALLCIISSLQSNAEHLHRSPDSFNLPKEVWIIIGVAVFIAGLVGLFLSIKISGLKKQRKALQENFDEEIPEPEEIVAPVFSLADKSLMIFVFGLFIPVILHIISLILGLKALVQIDQGIAPPKGRRPAKIAVVGSSICILLVIFLFVVMIVAE